VKYYIIRCLKEGVSSIRLTGYCSLLRSFSRNKTKTATTATIIARAMKNKGAKFSETLAAGMGAAKGESIGGDVGVAVGTGAGIVVGLAEIDGMGEEVWAGEGVGKEGIGELVAKYAPEVEGEFSGGPEGEGGIGVGLAVGTDVAIEVWVGSGEGCW
jgi:hypothetical protein